MNSDNKSFLERNGIVPEEIRKKLDCNIHSQSEINRIVDDYGFQKAKKVGEVSIADIVGYTFMIPEASRDIFESMDNFFDSEGDGYHRRSAGMLAYNKDNILERLRHSFEIEPIGVCETGEESYTILTNGLHRFTLLRILYLKELYDANGNSEKIARINKKYTIPANITGIDLDKTYCKYILSFAQSSKLGMRITDMGTYYDQNFRPTDNIHIRYVQDGVMGKKIVTSEEFFDMARMSVNEISETGRIPYMMEYGMSNCKSFQAFMLKKFPEFMQMFEERKSEGRE